MVRIFKKLLISLRTLGVRRTLFWICFGYLKVNRFILFRRRLDNPFPDVLRRDNVLVKQITLRKLKEVRKNNPKLPEEFSCDIFQGGKTCFMGSVDEKVAHIMWVFFPEDRSRFFNLKEGEAEINYAITLPEFRGLNLFPLTVKSINNWLRENQYKWLYGAIHDKNVNSIKAIEKCGFEKIGEIKHISFWRPKWKNKIDK